MARGPRTVVFPAADLAFGRTPEEQSDFRAVPSTDTFSGYNDQGGRGGYAPPDSSFGDPEGLKRFTGFGVDEADLARGYQEPTIREDPAFDAAAYRSRWSVPKRPDEMQGNQSLSDADWEFRERNMRSKGFLPRPRIPTERN